MTTPALTGGASRRLACGCLDCRIQLARQFARIVAPLEVEMIDSTNQIFAEFNGLPARIAAYGYHTAEEVMARDF